MRAARIALVGALLVAGGCATDATLARLSQADTGCYTDELRIEGRSSPLETTAWVAVCRGVAYTCSGTGASARCAPAGSP